VQTGAGDGQGATFNGEVGVAGMVFVDVESRRC
jgi:hypothetical protein